MEVILLEDIKDVGRRGDIVTVKPGYARNFLIPNAKATHVTADSIRQAEILRKHYIQQELEELEVLREKAAQLGVASITIEAKASEEGNLFGSVGPTQILEALQGEGYELELKSIKLEENIKKVGVYQVPVQLHPEIQTEIKLWVVEEKMPDSES